jgi:hypothetical protein
VNRRELFWAGVGALVGVSAGSRVNAPAYGSMVGEMVRGETLEYVRSGGPLEYVPLQPYVVHAPDTFELSRRVVDRSMPDWRTWQIAEQHIAHGSNK